MISMGNSQQSCGDCGQMTTNVDCLHINSMNFNKIFAHIIYKSAIL